jgi:hypothetical protein
MCVHSKDTRSHEHTPSTLSAPLEPLQYTHTGTIAHPKGSRAGGRTGDIPAFQIPPLNNTFVHAMDNHSYEQILSTISGLL